MTVTLWLACAAIPSLFLSLGQFGPLRGQGKASKTHSYLKTSVWVLLFWEGQWFCFHFTQNYIRCYLMLCLYWGLVSVIQIFSKAKFQTDSSLTICLTSLAKAVIGGLGSFWLYHRGMRLGRWAAGVFHPITLKALFAAFMYHLYSHSVFLLP